MKTVLLDSIKDIKIRKEGLTTLEVASQKSKYGLNEIVEVAGHPWLELITETIKDPMIWFLIAIGSTFYALGERTDAIILFLATLPLLLMDAFLHWRTQASTATLKSQLSSRTRVIRNNMETDIDTRDIVPGDLVVITPNSQLPADGLFETTSELQIDESVLTGESFPITKKSISLESISTGANGESKAPKLSYGYAGTRALTGHGHLRVLLTGRQTSYGEIVQSVSQMPHERTPLQKSIHHMVKLLIYFAVLFCLILAAVRMYQGHGWLDALLSSAMLAIAAIPEEFPIVFTFFLGVGIFRLAKNRALVRRGVSVENIGRVTQICTDKTGTITVGHLTLTHLQTGSQVSEKQLIYAARMASNSNQDPLDIAIANYAGNDFTNLNRLTSLFPFTESRRRETAIIENSDKILMAYTKGAPETILGMCSLPDLELAKWKQNVSLWAREGHKVIAVAQKAVSHPDQEPIAEYEFTGLLAFEDPPRPEVAAAMKYCHSHGIRVLMITGDHPDTAAAIARDSGLVVSHPMVISAEQESEKLTESWLEQNPHFLKNLNVVARCTPLQKLIIVQALKKSGELVAVTGDGVNDVPALKAADIGIAMGERGTRSAKEVSSIILTDDNFSTIVKAIREGRQLLENLRLSFKYLLLMHIPLVLTAAIIPLLGYPLLYLPIHIVWLELIIHPTALFGFQQKAKLDLPSKKSQSLLFSKNEIIIISLIGLGLTIVMGLAYILTMTEETQYSRAVALLIITLWSAGLTAFYSQLKTLASLIITIGTIAISFLFIQISEISSLLHLKPLHAHEWLAGFAAIAILIFTLKQCQEKINVAQ